MSIDKELIKMCDTPQIQDKWEPKLGDRVFSSKGTLGTGRFNKQTVQDMRTIIRIHENGNVTGKWNSGPSDTRIAHNFLYIPRIEDVLEWEPMTFQTVQIYTEPNLSTVKAITNSYHAETLLKALIVTFMDMKHNKSWNGEAWA